MRSVWTPITRNPPRPFVRCFECGDRELNEWNLLHRGGWQQSQRGWYRVYRCGTCANKEATHVPG